MMRIERAVVILTMAVAVSCSQNESDCTTLLRPLKKLGKKLAEAQSVSGNENAKPEQVTKALRSLAREAAGTADALNGTAFASDELALIATEAATAARSVATSAEQMARATEGMRGTDEARNTARIQRTLANVASNNIERLCASSPGECEALSPIMRERPPIPPAVNDAAEATSWNERTRVWLARLSTVAVRPPELEKQIANLTQTSRAYAAALMTLAAGDAPSTELAALSRNLSGPIGSLGAAMSRAQERCKP